MGFLDNTGLQHFLDKIKPKLVRGMTQAEYDSLSEENKNGFIIITDADGSGSGGSSSGGGMSQEEADVRYLQKTGGELTGELKIADTGISRVFNASGDKPPSISVFARKDLTEVKSNIHFIGPGNLEYNSENVPVQIRGVAAPDVDTDAANKMYVDTALSGKMDTSEYVSFDETGLHVSDMESENDIQISGSGIKLNTPDGDNENVTQIQMSSGAILLTAGENSVRIEQNGTITTPNGGLVTENAFEQELWGKQDNLIGNAGQIVGFNESGEATAVEPNVKIATGVYVGNGNYDGPNVINIGFQPKFFSCTEDISPFSMGAAGDTIQCFISSAIWIDGMDKIISPNSGFSSTVSVPVSASDSGISIGAQMNASARANVSWLARAYLNSSDVKYFWFAIG